MRQYFGTDRWTVPLALTLVLMTSGCQRSDEGALHSFAAPTTKTETETGAARFQCASITDETRSRWLIQQTDIEAELTSLLQEYVTADGHVDYRSWRSNEGDSSRVRPLLKRMSQARSQATALKTKMALAINFYNLATLDLILSRYEATLGDELSPLPGERSIRNIDGLDFSVWDEVLFDYGGEKLSLNQIEKGLIIPLRDARIHFAVNCASKGCPPLLPYAFTAASLDEQLDDASCRFVNSGTQTIFDSIFPESPIVFTSQIMDWYAQDFDRHAGPQFNSVLSFFAYYLDEETYGIKSADLLTKTPGTDRFLWSVEFDPYDWTLNEAEEAL